MDSFDRRFQDEPTAALPGPGTPARRRLALIGAAAGLVVAVAVAAGLALSGGDRPDRDDLGGQAEAAGPDDRAESSGGPVAAGAGPDQPASPEPAGGADGGDEPGAPVGAGGGSGGPGGGAPGNQPPVVEDAGLTSDGLILRIAPTVSDPDGDGVALLFEVDGQLVDPATTCFSDPLCKGDELDTATPTKAAVRLDHTRVGYRPEASVVIVATDRRGATTRETFSHQLTAVAMVAFRDLRFRVADPAACFRDEPERKLTAAVELTGAVTYANRYGRTLTANRSSVPLDAPRTVELAGQAPPPLRVSLSGSFAGWSQGFAAPRTYQQSQQVVVPAFTQDPDCSGEFAFSVVSFVR